MQTEDNSKFTMKLWPVYIWSLSYLKPYMGRVLLLVSAMLVISIIHLMIPKSIAYFIDVIYPTKNQSLFFNIFIVLGCCVVTAIVGAGILQNNLNRSIREKAARDLQFSVFSHLRKLGFSYYEKHPTGQILSLLNTEVAALQNLYRTHFPNLIEASIFSAISMIMMCTTSINLSIVVLPCFLLYYILGPYLDSQASKSSRQMANHRIDLNQKTYESISSLAEFRAFSAENWDIGRFIEKVKRFNTSMIRAYWYGYLRVLNKQITYFIGTIVIFGYGFFLLQNDGIKIGELVAFLLIYFIAVQKFSDLIANITEQKVLMYQAERLFHFMSLKPEVVEKEDAVDIKECSGKIQFVNVSFSYRPSQLVLRHFNLSIEAGERVALVGTSGNGKTTVLKLLARFYDPQEGQILLDGIPITDIKLESLRRSFGFIFQEIYMYGSTIKENILFGKPEATEEELIAAAKAAHADEFIQKLPDGYDTIVGERGVKLSGGQKQRIGIARMMINNSPIILLDEATSALDNASEAKVQEAMNTLLKGKTVIAVSHRLSSIKDYDRIAVIERGRIIEFGTYDQLLQAGNAFASLIRGSKEVRNYE